MLFARAAKSMWTAFEPFGRTAVGLRVRLGVQTAELAVLVSAVLASLLSEGEVELAREVVSPCPFEAFDELLQSSAARLQHPRWPSVSRQSPFARL